MKDQHERLVFDKRKIFVEYLPMLITFIGVVGCSIVFEQAFIKALPCCITLVVMLLNSRANRFGFILAIINSFIYIIGYFLEGVYGQVGSALFGIVIAFLSFFLWRKNARGMATKFRRLSIKQTVLFSALFILAYALSCFILIKIGGQVVYLDGLTLILGVGVNLLTMFAFIEAPFINIVNNVITLVIWFVKMFESNISSITYVIISVYNLYMIVRTCITYVSLYKRQKREEKVKNIDIN